MEERLIKKEEINMTISYKGSSFQKLQHFLRKLYCYLRWRPVFFHFGRNSVLEKPRGVVKPAAISIGDNVLIKDGARLEAVGNFDGKAPLMIIGNDTMIQFDFHCGAALAVTIGSNVVIGQGVWITDHDHDYAYPILSVRQNSKTLKCSPVVIEDGAYIGEGSVILRGVRIGKRSVIGANAVVTKDVPPFTIVVGVPARVIKNIEQVSQSDKTK